MFTQIVSYDLGGNQWVSPVQVSKQIQAADILEAVSDDSTIPLYQNSDAMSVVDGSLSPAIHEWRVIQFGFTGETTISVDRVDLGNNQWAWISPKPGLNLIYRKYAHEQNTPLYNQAGQPTGKIAANSFYRVYGVRRIDGSWLRAVG
ncbi:hypothetical protein MOO45_04050 [Bombilactobacillus folatiphilus]|uniref:Uncharacterized protein n=1 Tax=Bombilactobacillus folatiphilus TaxID=2923362 RepID=A0ABY4PBC6_9LACO|nr:hypothetical protein [Bombilactobacillus folatiphilus]UQS82821.1 hypothetical protein MOO45_04050 [Bombilactobacillus folatiphilus]